MTDELPIANEEAALAYIENRAAANPTTVGSAPSDIVTDVPIIGEGLMAADILQMVGESQKMEEGEEQPEAVDEFSNINRNLNTTSTSDEDGYNALGMRQGGGVETEAGQKMESKAFKLNRKKADLNKDGKLSSYEKARGEAIQKSMVAEMNCGGMMADPFAPMNVIVGMDGVSGNDIPAGSMAHEVRDDIPAMLSEGEYVVPADVVRWHGLKTFEALRGEAKMAMGLMAEHGRMSFVDEDTKEPVEYEEEEYEDDDDIENENVEVEEAEVKVVHAAEGTSVESTPASTFYRYVSRLNPVTRRYEFVAIDPATGQQVAPDQFDPARSTRYTLPNLLETIYGKAPAEEEETAEEAVVRKTEFRDSDDGDGPDVGGESVPRTIENDFGFQKPNRLVAGLFGLINPVLGAAVRGAQNLNNASAVSAARQYLGMKPLGFSKSLKGAIMGEYNQPGSFDYSISFDDETDALTAMGFIDSRDAAGVNRADVRSELVKQGFDPNSPTLGMSISDIIGEEQKTAIEEAKAGRSPIPVEDAQGIAASKIQEDMRAREAAREQAQKAREQREADEREAQRQEAARAAENARKESDRQQREADRLEAAREEAQRQRDQDEREDSGGSNDNDDGGFDGWGGGGYDNWSGDDESVGYGYNKGGYVARKNTPKKVLIKR
jgi:hypothetical protein